MLSAQMCLQDQVSPHREHLSLCYKNEYFFNIIANLAEKKVCLCCEDK